MKMKIQRLVAVCLAILLSISLIACSKGNDSNDKQETTAKASEESTTEEVSTISAGTYTATEAGYGGNITVTVTVNKKGEITDLAIEDESEKEIGDEAIKKIQEDILASKSPNVDAVSGATFTSNAIFTALSSSLSQAGVDTTGMQTVTGEDEKLSTDVVIVGAGGSGMAAGLAAASKGAKVVIVEQTSTYGGSALYGADGFFAIESSQQSDEGIYTSSEEMYNLFMDYTHYSSKAALIRAFLEKSASTVEWVGKNGNPVSLIDNIQLAHTSNIKTYHKFDNKTTGFENWYNKLIDLDVQIIFNTKVTDLIQDDDGTIKGVVGKKADGSKLTVNADATILATGGYASNAKMVNQYLGFDYENLNVLDYASTGEGILMAIKAGADNYGLNTSLINGAIARDGYSSKMPAVCTTPLLWVNNAGKRFVNEDIIYDYTLWGNATKAVGGSYWIIVDGRTLEQFAKGGTPYTNTFVKEQMIKEGLPVESFATSIKKDKNLISTFDKVAEDTEWAAKADTVVDLAKQMGVPAKNLVDTIAQYNKAVDAGKDTLFHKTSDYLKYDVTTGPFYAIQVSAAFEGTLGGISVNEKLEVVKPDATTIPGLYAVGNNVGGLYENSVPPEEGIPLGFAINSGRIAGENAAKYVE